MTNQFSPDRKGLGEYCPRPMIRMSEEQYEKFLADAAAARADPRKASQTPSQYARCKLGLEPWPGNTKTRKRDTIDALSESDKAAK
jgi:hypothetical protein